MCRCQCPPLPPPQGLRSSGGKAVVVLGDLNCAHKEIDVYAPKKFTKAAGFTQVCVCVCVCVGGGGGGGFKQPQLY